MPAARRTFNQEVNGPLLKTAPGENVSLTCCADRWPEPQEHVLGMKDLHVLSFFSAFFFLLNTRIKEICGMVQKDLATAQVVHHKFNGRWM